MEENAQRDPDRPEDPGEESNRAMRPLLNQPGNQHPHRTTNFYIDNILRPDFGRMGTIGTLVGEGDRLKVTIQREEQSGNKSPSTAANLRQPGEEAADGPQAGRPDLVEGNAVMKTRRDPQTNPAPAAKPMLWPAWVYCTRYSDRPSSGPRSRKTKKVPAPSREDKRPRTAFTAEQLQRLKAEFQGNRYLTEQRRRCLAQELHLNESQIKIWFQNKRAKIKKSSASKNSLALHLRAQGLYDHSTASSD